VEDAALFAIVKFFFKLVFYWPFKLLWEIGNWIYDICLIRRAEAHSRRFQSEQTASQQQAEQQIRSRNTLYAGSQQPDQ
jgi:hypothetical protein